MSFMSQISIFISLIALAFNIIVLCVAKKKHDEASQSEEVNGK